MCDPPPATTVAPLAIADSSDAGGARVCHVDGAWPAAMGVMGGWEEDGGGGVGLLPAGTAGTLAGTKDGGTTPDPDPDPEPTDELQRCIDSCSTLTSCGAIDVGEGAQCNSDCNGLSDGQRKAFADCVGDWDCSGDIPPCLGLECGPAYDCPVGQDCLGGTCL